METIVSVVIPFFNELALIERAVSSVFKQDIDGVVFQVIIVNDGNMRQSEIQQAVGNRNNLVIIKNEGLKGPGGARNAGIIKAKGDYIAFLDADDYWSTDKIRKQLISLSSGANFCCTAYSYGENYSIIKPPKEIKSPEDVFLKQGIGTSTVLVKKSLISACRFNDFRFCQDIDFWYQLARIDDFSFSMCEEPLVHYYTGGSTRNKFVQLRYLSLVLNHNSLPFVVRCRVLVRYVIRGIVNHYLR